MRSSNAKAKGIDKKPVLYRIAKANPKLQLQSEEANTKSHHSVHCSHKIEKYTIIATKILYSYNLPISKTRNNNTKP